MKNKIIKTALLICLFVPVSVSPNQVEEFNLIDYKLEMLQREVMQTRQLILITIKELQKESE